jgi:hypothetical protein
VIFSSGKAAIPGKLLHSLECLSALPGNPEIAERGAGTAACFQKLMDLERISNFSLCVCRRLYGITATASFEYVLSCELVPSAVTT